MPRNKLRLDDSLRYHLAQVKFDNFVKTFQYKKAFRALKAMKEKLPVQYKNDQGEEDATFQIFKLLQNQPAQK